MFMFIASAWNIILSYFFDADYIEHHIIYKTALKLLKHFKIKALKTAFVLKSI